MDKKEVKLHLGCPIFNLRIWWLRVRPAPGAPPHFRQMDSTKDIQLIRLLLARLERVSVDSYWAHRASGVRGALLKKLEELEKGTFTGQADIHELISSSFHILNRAAREKH